MYEADPTKKQAAIDKMLETKRRNGTFKNGMSGKIKTLVYKEVEYKFQGYEDIVMIYLIDSGIDFKCREEVPAVKFPQAMSGKYLPDLYLPNYNLLIDVKSERTITLKQDTLIAKQNAALDNGYNFVYFAISSKHVDKQRQLSTYDQMQFNNFLDMLISSQALEEGRFNDYPVIRSTLQAIGSGSAKGPETDRDIV